MTNRKYVSQNSKRVCLAVVFPIIFALGCGKVSPVATTTQTTKPVNNPRNTLGIGPKPISLSSTGSATVTPGDMGSAGNYVLLAKTGISNVTGSTITGNIGVSPAAATFITGFSLVADGTNVFSTSTSVVGNVYAADYAVPTPANMTSAISNIEAAYTEAAGRTPPDYNELGAGGIGSLTLTPGLYTWTNSVTIPTDVTFSGGANDVWVLQIAGNLTLSAAKSIILSGGALAKNIYWQVAGQVTIFTTAHFEGIILSQTGVTLQANASLTGRAYAQSAVVLNDNVITQP